MTTRAGERVAETGGSGADEDREVDGKGVLAALESMGWSVQGLRGEVLRPSRYRPVFRYRVECTGADGGGAVERILIGKADYRRGGEATFAFMRRLWDAGLGGGRASTIPEPIAYLDDLAILVQTEAPGRCLHEWLVAGDLGPARAAGRWLGGLHHTRLDGGDGELPADFEERKLSRYCDELSEVFPALAGRLPGVVGATLAALASVGEGVRVPTHGDYQPKNIYVDGEHVTVIDWDRAALACPARDVGHFIGQSLTMSYSKTGTFDRGRAWNAAFLAGYGQVGVGTMPAGLSAYVARTLVEVLYYKLVVKPVADASFVPVWLDELDAALAA